MVSAVMLAWVPAGVGAGLARPVRARLRDCREASGAGLSLSAGWGRGSQGRGLASPSCPQEVWACYSGKMESFAF